VGILTDTIEAELLHTKGSLQNHAKCASTAVDCVVHDDE